MKQDIREKLLHSTVPSNQSGDSIIYEGKNCIPSGQGSSSDTQERRKRVIKERNDLIEDAKKAKKLIKKQNVNVYYTLRAFVIQIQTKFSNKSQETGKKHPPYLFTYGEFPDSIEAEADWDKEVMYGVEEFARATEQDLDDETKEMIMQSLRKAKENVLKKKRREAIWRKFKVYFILLIIAVVIPLLLGWIFHKQASLLIQQIIDQEKSQQTTLQSLQQTTQRLIMQMTALVVVNNIVLLLIFRLPFVSIVMNK